MSKTQKGLLWFSFISTMLCVQYVTLFSRSPSLAQTIRLTPFWSFSAVVHGSQSPREILLNFVLFIPVGWYLAALLNRKKVLCFVISILGSIAIELVQYYTGRGTADIDDIICNGLGGITGVGLFWLCSIVSHIKWKHALLSVFSIVFLLAGFVEIYAIYKSPRQETRQREFDFAIQDIVWENDILTVNGICDVYDRETPNYRLFLLDESGQKRELNTEIEGNRFKAFGNAEKAIKYEILIRFKGHESFSTATFINEDHVEYVAGTIPTIVGLPEDAILKSYCEMYDVLVFQIQDRLLWLIGTETDPKTEIIFHIYTNQKDKLPENRIKYGFDNRGFKVEAGKELEPIGHYRVFEKEIPSAYHVAEAVVGFNTDGKVTWKQNFRVDS